MKPKWSDSMLISAIALSKNWSSVCKKLGLLSKSRPRIKRRAIKLGADFSHFSWRRKYDIESLKNAIKDSISYRQVLIKLGMNSVGSAYHFLKEAIKKCGIDTSHFLGKSHNRGKKPGPKRPIEDYLSGKFKIGSNDLKKRLIKEKIFEEKCSCCNLTEWLGKKIPLELDHIDGDRSNNNLINLRLLCPNCHTFTPTYRGKNTNRGKKSEPGDRIRTTHDSVPEKNPSGVEALCWQCGKIFRLNKSNVKKKNYCSGKCFYMSSRRCNHPTKEELIDLMNTLPMTQIGEKYGVSDNAVKKWAKNYGIEMPSRLGFWTKNKKAPPNLQDMLNSMPIFKVAQICQVDEQTVRKWIKINNLTHPDNKYWALKNWASRKSARVNNQN